MILEIEEYHIKKILNDEGDELDPVDLQKKEYQQVNQYWDKYNFVQFLLSFVELRENNCNPENPIHKYPFRKFLDLLILKRNKMADFPSRKGYMQFDLDSDYLDLLQISKKGRMDDYWIFPEIP